MRNRSSELGARTSDPGIRSPEFGVRNRRRKGSWNVLQGHHTSAIDPGIRSPVFQNAGYGVQDVHPYSE